MRPDIPNVIRCIKADGSGMTTIEGSNIESYFLDEDENTLELNFSSGRTLAIINDTGCNKIAACDIDDCIYGRYGYKPHPVLGGWDYCNWVEGLTPEGKTFRFDSFSLEGYSKTAEYIELFFASGKTVQVLNNFETYDWTELTDEDILAPSLERKYTGNIRPSKTEAGNSETFNVIHLCPEGSEEEYWLDSFSIEEFRTYEDTCDKQVTEIVFCSGKRIAFPVSVLDGNTLADTLNDRFRTYWKPYPTITGGESVEKLMEGVFRLTPKYMLENIGHEISISSLTEKEIRLSRYPESGDDDYVLIITDERDGIVSWTFHEIFNFEGEETIQEICDGRTVRETGENIISRDFEYGDFRMVNRTDCGWAGVILKDILRYGQLSESERKEMGDILYLTNYDLDRICFSKDGESVEPVDHYCIRTWEMSEEGRIDWTFFKMIYEKDGSGHGEEVCDGASYYQL